MEHLTQCFPHIIGEYYQTFIMTVAYRRKELNTVIRKKSGTNNAKVADVKHTFRVRLQAT